MCEHSRDFQAAWCAATHPIAFGAKVGCFVEENEYCDLRDEAVFTIQTLSMRMEGDPEPPSIRLSIALDEWWPYRASVVLSDGTTMEWDDSDCRCMIANDVRNLMPVVGCHLIARAILN